MKLNLLSQSLNTFVLITSFDTATTTSLRLKIPSCEMARVEDKYLEINRKNYANLMK